MQKIRKAVLPVAGMGTRFLPATKANPKEMLTVVDKPLIQYSVEEAVAAGIDELIFVTSYSKRAIEDHFDSNYELESRLEQKGNLAALSLVRNIVPEGVRCVYIRQSAPLGLGHAILCAKDLIGNEPFVVLLADDLIDSAPKTCLQQMLDCYQKYQANVIAVEEVPLADTRRYGIVGVNDTAEAPYLPVSSIVEKPEAKYAPSRLAVVGRYLLFPEIFNFLEKATPGAEGEIQLTDAIAHLLLKQKIYACRFSGERYDCGNKLGYLKATLNYALKHSELAPQFKAYLKNMTQHFVD